MILPRKILVIIVLLCVIGALFLVNDKIQKDFMIQRRLDQLVNTGAVPNEASGRLFDSIYGSWAKGNEYNETIRTVFIPLWLYNQTLAEDIAKNAIGYPQSIFTVSKLALNYPEVAVSSPRQWKSLVKLLHSIPDIDKQPMLLAASAQQIEVLLYDNKLVGETQISEDRVWDEFVVPTIGYIVALANSGTISTSSLSREEARMLVMPPDVLELSYLHETNRLWVGYSPANQLLERGIENAKDQKTFFRFLYDNYNDKEGLPYWNAIHRANMTYGSEWPNSLLSYHIKLNVIRKTDDLTLFIYGAGGVGNAFDKLTGQSISPLLRYLPDPDIPYYSVLVGRFFGRPVYVQMAYKLDGVTAHNEPYVKAQNGRYIGLWSDIDAFVSDYAGSGVGPQLIRKKPDAVFDIIYPPQS